MCPTARAWFVVILLVLSADRGARTPRAGLADVADVPDGTGLVRGIGWFYRLTATSEHRVRVSPRSAGPAPQRSVIDERGMTLDWLES